MVDKAFPKGNVVPESGTIKRSDGLYDIEIKLKPFQLDDEAVKTSFRLEGIDLPVTDLAELTHRSFAFPVNPEEGYIDGSIYLRHVHNPADVTKITFGEFYGDSIDATIHMKIDFEFEGTGFKNMNTVVKTRLMIRGKKKRTAS